MALLESRRSDATWSVTRSATEPSKWKIAGNTWTGTVEVDPTRWIGMTFEAEHPSGRVAFYAIDTDAYDRLTGKNRWFADEIEQEILDFLDHLKDGRVLRGLAGKRLVVTFPQGNGYMQISAGRLITTGRLVRHPPFGHEPVL